MNCWQEALFPGVWRLRDGREVEFTPADIEHHFRRLRDLRATKFPIPGYWDHMPTDRQAAEIGMTSYEANALRARHTFGEIQDARIVDGRLQLLVECPDERDAQQLKKTGFCSPHIEEDFTDPLGNFWPGASILHLAATPYPIQYPQRRFEFGNPVADLDVPDTEVGPTVAVSMSQALKAGPICLSQASYRGRKMPQTEQEEMPDLKGADDKGLDDLGATDFAEEEGQAEEEDADQETPGDEPVSSELIHVLHKLGIMIGAQTSKDDLENHLLVAARTKLEHEGKGDDDEAEDAETNPTEEQAAPGMTGNEPLPEIAEAPPVMMSQADQNKLAAENARLKKQLTGAVTNGRKSLHERIVALHTGGFIDRDRANGLIGELKTVNLSLAEDGTGFRPNTVQGKVEMLESLVKDGTLKSAFNRQGQGTVALSQANGTEEIPERVAGGNGAANRKDQEEAGDELITLAGGTVRK